MSTTVSRSLNTSPTVTSFPQQERIVQLRPLLELVNPQIAIYSTPSKSQEMIAALLLSLILFVVVIVISVSEETDDILFRIDINDINNLKNKIRNEQESNKKNEKTQQSTSAKLSVDSTCRIACKGRFIYRT
jgi:hypothetical protein